MNVAPVSLSLPLPALYILYRLRQAGYEAYIVGGAVRDFLRNVELSSVDFDFTTNAKPEEIQAVFPESFYDNQFGTVAITFDEVTAMMGITEVKLQTEPPTSQDKIIDTATATKLHESLTPASSSETATQSHPFFKPFEITTYRSQEVYADDHRRPTSLQWGTTLSEDLSRRDFTINALALDIKTSWLETVFTQSVPTTLTDENWLQSLTSSDFTIVDQFNGQADLEQKIIRTVGDPHQRFQEDALRMLRAIRLSVQLNYEIDPSTFDALTQHATLIEHISWERIRDEFMKMIASEYPAESIELLDQTGLLAHILPELQTGKGVAQGGHHTTDVWTHSLDALASCPSNDPIVRLATLLHDVGKPATYREQNGTITFYNHEIIGARMVKVIARRLRLSSRELNRLYILVRFHMFYYQPHNTDAAIRRFMRKVGLENVDDILDVREGDRLGSGARKTSWRLEEMKQRMIAQLHQPMDSRDLAIDGHDLMTELQLKPGPILGMLLQQLLEKVLDQPELNTKEQLLELARQFVADNSATNG